MKVKDILNDCSIWIPGKNYNSNNNPVISILLPTFKRAKSGYFEKAVRSVLNQTLKNIELIIIDDCSTDGTYDLIKHFMKCDDRVSCIRHKFNVGLPAISEYEGYLKARGEYIAFIFDDNEWQLDYLDKSILYMIKNSIKASYGIVKNYYGEGINDFQNIGVLNNNSNLLSFNFIPNSGVILHRDVIEDVGLYDPHLSLIRFCDWDLWRRIYRKYIFDFTGIYAGNEYGVTLNDSLGNTVDMNRWVSLERMYINRDSMLKPLNFGEVDIIEYNSSCSELFIKITKDLLNKYKYKKWYGLYKVKEDTDFNKDIKRVIVLSNCIDASTILSFGRLYDKNIVFKFLIYPNIFIEDLVYADTLVVIRDLDLVKENIKLYESLNLNLYFYLDDNFIELYNSDIDKDNKKNSILYRLAKNLTFDNLSVFNGVFLSSRTLIEYFSNRELHHNLILLEPSIENVKVNKFQKNLEDEPINIAFMGGNFRKEYFYENVMPALKRLSKNRRINLYTNIDDNYVNSNSSKFDNFSIINIDFNLCLETILLKYGRNNIHILIHCGDVISNNKYKTENALINATSIGAVLVINKILPYSNLTDKDVCIFTEDDSELDWYNTLKRIIDDMELRKVVYNNAYKHCVDRYSLRKVSYDLNQELLSLECISDYEYSKRYSILTKNRFAKENNIKDNSIIYLDKPRSLLNAPICFSTLIKKKRNYKVVCNKESFEEIGICFDSFSDYISGSVTINIIKNYKVIRTNTINLDEIIRDNWTYIRFDKVIDSLFEVYTIELSFNYDDKSGLVGVFEDRRNRSIVYRGLKKFGLNPQIKNILFVDFRGV